MGKQPFISHVVNGYSRYDVPESKAFTVTPGILYPVRIDFINARDRVRIEQGIDVRSNPFAVPSFNPYTVRLHRFWVPLQLYHPEMRTNSSKFDMNSLSLNWLPMVSNDSTASTVAATKTPYSNSLMFWLRYAIGTLQAGFTPTQTTGVAIPASYQTLLASWVNGDSYLAYWDIVRNYYSYSQWSLYSFAWPASWRVIRGTDSGASWTLQYNTVASFFTQSYGNLEYLDAFYESQFYPAAVTTTNNTYNRFNLFNQIVYSDLYSTGAEAGDGYPVAGLDNSTITGIPASQFALSSNATATAHFQLFGTISHPMAVVPSSPDRFSRLIPNGSSNAVSMTGVDTIPKLAVASRLQEYKDLLGAGGNRFSDWLETFFASKIEHVDRPKLLFSASQTVNVQVVMNQSGNNNFNVASAGSFGITNPLGQQGGSVAFNGRLGRVQSYYFREPGYMIDMLSIRPVYYWSGIRPDYVNYEGADYFNPVYNDIGYQDVPWIRFGPQSYSDAGQVAAVEPCYNEYRSSYDEVLGQLCSLAGNAGATDPSSVSTAGFPLYAYWVQQRSLQNFNGLSTLDVKRYAPALFVDMASVNSVFSSNIEDNFFVNMSWNVQKKNLVNKTFATRLSNR